MGLGAIVVVGAGLEDLSSTASLGNAQALLLAEPLACIEVLGRPMLERTIERLLRAGVEIVSILVPPVMSYAVQPFPVAFKNVELKVVADVCQAVTETLKDYSCRGIDHAFVVSANTYTETDLLDLFYFHREARQVATRALDVEEHLDLWVVDCAKANSFDINALLGRAGSAGPSYFIREYVNRLTHARDLRRLVADVLRGRCAIRPSGIEVKPGIWMDDGAEVHRRARIVAPAYIGRGCEIKEDTLTTRFSSIERGCYIDYGTVIEDSSILANTRIGIWLDVCHSVAKGNKLFNLQRNVILEISDPSIMRSSVREAARKTLGKSHATQPMVAQEQEEAQEETPAPERWQLGANPIQG